MRPQYSNIMIMPMMRMMNVMCGFCCTQKSKALELFAD